MKENFYEAMSAIIIIVAISMWVSVLSLSAFKYLLLP